MAGSVTTLLIAGPTARVALRASASVSVADLLNEAMAPAGGDLDASSGWELATLRGERLDPERLVGQLGLADGAMLVLRPVAQTSAEAINEDLPEAVAGVVQSSEGRWAPGDVGTLAAAVSVGGVAALGVAAYQLSSYSERAAVAGIGAVATLVVGAAAARYGPLARLGRWLAIAGLALWGLAGEAGALVAYPRGEAAFAAVGVLLGAVIVWALIAEARPAVTAAAFGAAICGVGCAAIVPLKLSMGVAAALAGLLALGSLGMLPGLALQLTGTLELDSAEPGVKGQLQSSLGSAREYLAWLISGAAAVLAGSGVLLALDPSWFGPALAAMIALAMALQARHHGFWREAAPLGVAALVVLGAVEMAVIIRLVPADTVPLAAACVAGIDVLVALAIAFVAGSFTSTVDSRRLFGTVQWVVDATIVPLLLGVVGVFDFVATQAKHLL